MVDLPIGPHRPHAVTELLPRIGVTEPRRAERAARAPASPRPALSDHAEVYSALVLGTRDYLRKNGFTEAVIGLSGGIDSSLVATIAVDALGAGRVHGLSMPSRYSSEGSRHDAAELAERLGIDLKVVPIEEAHVAFASMLVPVLGREPFGLTDENLQSRLRGVLLMAVSNAKGWIVLTTGNKSEMATGYSTLYGDSAGGFAVIKDVPKTLVYDLCRYRNTQAVLEGLPGPDSRQRARQAALGRVAPGATRRPVAPALRGARPGAPGLRGARPHCGRSRRRRGSTPPWSTGSCGSSTAPSTSAARCRRACASPPRRSARTGACPSPTATAPRLSRSPGGG